MAAARVQVRADAGQQIRLVATRPAFTFRFLESGEKAEDITAATERAEAAAVAWLSERGYAYKNVRSQATDMAEVPLSKRQRHAITKAR
jgi:hypothetical protein